METRLKAAYLTLAADCGRIRVRERRSKDGGGRVRLRGLAEGRTT